MASIEVMQGCNYRRGKGGNCLLASLPWLHIDLHIENCIKIECAIQYISCVLVMWLPILYIMCKELNTRFFSSLWTQSCISWFDDRFSKYSALCLYCVHLASSLDITLSFAITCTWSHTHNEPCVLIGQYLLVTFQEHLARSIMRRSILFSLPNFILLFQSV